MTISSEWGRGAAIIGSFAALGLLAGCAGGVSTQQSSSDGGGEGFAYGASQDEVDAAIEGLEPVKLVMQPSGASPDAVTAPSGLALKEEIERRSGGQISIEIVWAQAIAGYAEVDDALTDGRLDIAYQLPAYNPQQHAGFDALISANSMFTSRSMTDQLVNTAVQTELAWSSDSVLEGYTSQGLTPLAPVEGYHPNFTMCKDRTIDLDDWSGRLVRVGTTSHDRLAQALGASPVSLELTETYEALQRGTVDCTVTNMNAAYAGGELEIAKNIGYATEGTFSAATGAWSAGSSFQTLPLPYQQIIFDAFGSAYAASVESILDTIYLSMDKVQSSGGSVDALGDDVSDVLVAESDSVAEKLNEEGHFSSDVRAQIDDSAERWKTIVNELEIAEDGEFNTITEWYTPGTIDYGSFGDRMYEEILLDHRPS